jgi:hypothetical protein
MKKILRENGLSITLLSIFLATLGIGQSVTGYYVHNAEQKEHGSAPLGFGRYVFSSHFMEATMENWESEFLQMFVYVIFTTFLFQKGSSESKSLDEPELVDRDPQDSSHKRDTPWPVRTGGFVLRLYEHSLSLAFLLLFLICFVLHAISGAQEYSQEQLQHGGGVVSVGRYMIMPRFWFESFQNWQSEFLAIGSMVVLSIFLRERGSPESKPVDAPHGQTGSE